MSLPSQGSDVVDMLVTALSGIPCGKFSLGIPCTVCGEIVPIKARGKCVPRFCKECLRKRRSARATDWNRTHKRSDAT